MGTKKSTAAKPATETTNTAAAAPATKPRKAPVRKAAPIRKLKDNPAGHFADSLTAVSKRMAKIRRMISRWPQQNAAAAGLDEKAAAVISAADALGSSFNTLAEAGATFKLSFPRVSKHSFKVDERVMISPEGLDLLHRDFPSLCNDHDIRVAITYKDGEKSIPLVLPVEGQEPKFLGRVSYKFIVRFAAESAPAAFAA